MVLLKVSQKLEPDVEAQKCPGCRGRNYKVCSDGLCECNNCGRVFLPVASTAGIAPELKKIRVRRGIKVNDVARMVGVSRCSLWKWETGRSNPSMAHAKDLVQIYRELCSCDDEASVI